jgi:hypothetical protein
VRLFPRAKEHVLSQVETTPDDFRRQALKLNDEVLQGLVVAKMAFESGDNERGQEALAASLDQLRQAIDQMLSQGAGPEAGDFVRGHMLMGRMDD